MSSYCTCSSSSQNDSSGILMSTYGRVIPRQSIWLLAWVLRQLAVLGAMELPLALTCGCVSRLMGLSCDSALLNAALFWLSQEVSLHFLIISVVIIPFRRYCPSLQAFSTPTAECSKSNAVNSILSLLRGTAFPSATSENYFVLPSLCNLKHNTYGSFLSEDIHRSKDMDVEGMKGGFCTSNARRI